MTAPYRALEAPRLDCDVWRLRAAVSEDYRVVAHPRHTSGWRNDGIGWRGCNGWDFGDRRGASDRWRGSRGGNDGDRWNGGIGWNNKRGWKRRDRWNSGIGWQQRNDLSTRSNHPSWHRMHDGKHGSKMHGYGSLRQLLWARQPRLQNLNLLQREDCVEQL